MNCESCRGVFKIKPLKCQCTQELRISEKDAVMKFQSYLETLNPYFNFDTIDLRTKRGNANDSIDKFIDNFFEMVSSAYKTYKTNETIQTTDHAISHLLNEDLFTDPSFRNVVKNMELVGFLEIGCRTMENAHHIASRLRDHTEVVNYVLAQGLDFKIRKWDVTGSNNSTPRRISRSEHCENLTTYQDDEGGYTQDDEHSSSASSVVEVYTTNPEFIIPYPDSSLNILLLTDVLFTVPDLERFIILCTCKLADYGILIINNEDCKSWQDAYHLDVKYHLLSEMTEDYLPICEYRSRSYIRNILEMCGYILISSSVSLSNGHYGRYIDFYQLYPVELK